jgi:hypothetical protein
MQDVGDEINDPPGAVVKGPIISRLQQANGQDGSIMIRL